jgi:hypothetical protein
MKRIAASLSALLLGACSVVAPVPAPQKPLDAAGQAKAADQLVRAFSEACLTAKGPGDAVARLKLLGWPKFNTVWNDADGVFYAGLPSPAGIYVLTDAKRPSSLQCVGHYAAHDDRAMQAAVARKFGPGGPAPKPSPGDTAWAFRVKDGAFQPFPAEFQAIASAPLGPGESIVYLQVGFNRAYNDVASVFSIRYGPKRG